MNAVVLLAACVFARSTSAALGSPEPVTSVWEEPVHILVGTWTHADDPSGRVSTDPVYVGSAIVFGADGGYAFRLGGSAFALEGTWEARGAEGDALRVHTDYGRGRQNDLMVLPRRAPDGIVIGIEVRERDGTSRYYTRTEATDG